MPTLELLVDPKGVEDGVRKAKRSLDDLGGAAGKVSASLSSIGQLGTGSVQLASGIAQTAKAFGDLNTTAGLFSASRVLLDIGNTARDFQQLRGAVGGAASAWRVLGTAIAANPIGAVAVAVGAAATAFEIFGSGARKALVDYKALADEVQRNRIDTSVDKILGTFDPAAEAKKNADAIRKLLTGLQAGQGLPGGFNQLRDTTGIGSVDLVRLLNQAGNPQALQYLREGQITLARGGGVFNPATGAFSDAVSTSPSAIRITDEQARQVLERLYGRQSALAGNPTVFGQGGLFRPVRDFVSQSRTEIDTGLLYKPQPGGGVLATDQAARQLEVYTESLQRQAEQLERATRAGEQFGATIGGALFDAIAGANTLRGALASALQSVARQGFESGVSGIFGAAVRGLTQAQQQSNAGIPQVGGPGITTTGP